MNVCVCVRGVRSVNLYGEIDVFTIIQFRGNISSDTKNRNLYMKIKREQ